MFSAMGHREGSCEGVGGLVKHFATRHNLSNDPTEYIQSAKSFFKKVQNETLEIKKPFP